MSPLSLLTNSDSFCWVGVDAVMSSEALEHNSVETLGGLAPVWQSRDPEHVMVIDEPDAVII